MLALVCKYTGTWRQILGGWVIYCLLGRKYPLRQSSNTGGNESFSAQKLESERNLLECVHWGPNDHQIKPPNPPPATIFFFKKGKIYLGGFSVKSAIRAKPVGMCSLGSQ